jgi:regulator of replication initiation timing
MSKKLRELLQALETEKAKVRSLLAENKVLDAEKVMEEVRSLQKAVALQQELEALEDQTLDDAHSPNPFLNSSAIFSMALSLDFS